MIIFGYFVYSLSVVFTRYRPTWK